MLLVMIVRVIAAGLLLLQAPLVAAQTSTFSGIVSSNDGYVTGTTVSGSITLTATFPNGVAASGDTITFTVSPALFTAGTHSGGEFALSAGTWNPSWVATSNAVTGTYTGSTPLTGALTLTVTGGGLDTNGLPPAGAVTLTATSTDNGGGTTGDAAGTAANIFYTVAVPTVTLTTADYNSGTQPSQLVVTFTLPTDLAASQTLEIVANRQIFAASQTTGLAVTGTTFSHTTPTTYTLTMTSSGDTMGTAVTLTLTSPLIGALPSSGGAVTMDVNLGTPVSRTLMNDLTGFGTVVASGGGGGAMGDPVTWYGKHRTEFLLPYGQHSVLFQTPDMVVLAWPFAGLAEDQWIGYVVVVSNTGDTIVEVAIRKNLLGFDRTKIGPNAFETMDIIMGPSSSPSQLKHIPGFDDQINHPQGYITQFARISTVLSAEGAACLKERYVPCRESVLVTGRYAKLAIESSSAVEYFGNEQAAIDHSHLDVQIFDMRETHTFSGVLPEIWGFSEMSNGTRAMIKSQMTVELALNSTTALVKSNTSEDMSVKTANMISI